MLLLGVPASLLTEQDGDHHLNFTIGVTSAFTPVGINKKSSIKLQNTSLKGKVWSYHNRWPWQLPFLRLQVEWIFL